MKIERHFTKHIKDGQTVFDLVEWKRIDVEIKNWVDGSTIMKLDGAEFPKGFSESACNIITANYFKKDVPGLGKETSYKEVVHRMVDFWVGSLVDERVINSEKQAEILYDELAYTMLLQMWAPNSPQFFNTGLERAYGMGGRPQGHYYYDLHKEKVVESQDSYTRTQGSACFILGIEDTLLGPSSITDNITTETRLFKHGSGVGSNFSVIRGEGEGLTGGGKSSGLMSFLKVLDANAGAIKSGGTTRRAAKMNIVDIDHPEVREFIKWKSVEEEKVRALGREGYDTSIAGEAYATVSGQNVNNSVRMTDEFMNAVKEGSYWRLKERTTNKVVKEVLARDLWDDIAQCAWECGDPGVQFHDTINAMNTCATEEINGSNPCSEYMFIDNTACNLASINLGRFVTKDNKFNVEDYAKLVRLVHLVLESTIHWGQFPTEQIALRSHQYRTTGLGYTNLGGMLMEMGIPYGSQEGRTLAAYLMSVLTVGAYETSVELAEEVGPYDKFEEDAPEVNKVLNEHWKKAKYEVVDAANWINKYVTGDVNRLEEAWFGVVQKAGRYGVRNAQVSVLAPTGTIAFAMDCATTSSEPMYSHIAYKKLVDGSSMKIVNPVTEKALVSLGLTEEQIKEVTQFVVDTESFTGAPHLSKEDLKVFKVASDDNPDLMVSADEHINMVAALSPHLSGAISKTINLPNSATKEDIKDAFMKSWEKGIKAITVYRDGCKASQPMNLKIEESEEKTSLNNVPVGNKDVTEVERECLPERIKLEGIRQATVHEVEVGGIKLYITVSRYLNGEIGEIYTSTGKQGTLTKGVLDSLSLIISKMLQFGIPAKEISRSLRGQRYEPSGFVGGHPNIKMCDSISDLISKIIDIELGDYTNCQVKPERYQEAILERKEVPEGVELNYSKVCVKCGTSPMRKAGTCYYCTNCGDSSGGCS